MKWGALTDYFVGVAWKRLSAHEVDRAVSHGPEFQGVAALTELLGTTSREFITTYMTLNDDEEQATSLRSTGKWYDAREYSPHRASEWRFYYPAEVEAIPAKMRAGDLLVMALMKNGELVVMLAPGDSTREAQLRVLFGLKGTEQESLQTLRFDPDATIGLVRDVILEELGLARPSPDSTGDGEAVLAMAEELSRDYPTALPSGKVVSGLVQVRVSDVDPVAEPDGTLVRWIEAEEALYRHWEDGLIARRLKQGFVSPSGELDVQAFRDFAMSNRQSRVSRAGGALQLHVSRVLEKNRIRFDAQATTENGEKPDFLFPGAQEYHDPSFPDKRLRMLAVKFTAKDRWRQVLNEAQRVERKHLLTLEATISTPQLAAMRSAKLQLVLPRPYLGLYPVAAKREMLSLGEFIVELRATGVAGAS
jgi:hypothetical protein